LRLSQFESCYEELSASDRIYRKVR
jgi:hypothetical protein